MRVDTLVLSKDRKTDRPFSFRSGQTVLMSQVVSVLLYAESFMQGCFTRHKKNESFPLYSLLFVWAMLFEINVDACGPIVTCTIGEVSGGV